MKTIIIGLDGASFTLIDSWLNDGKLPNLQHLISNGVRGKLKSCLPPVTSPNWKCYSTGKNPGKLGIFWWENIDFKNRRITTPSSRIKAKEIWDYISENNGRIGLINTPLTYPPKKVNGFMIAGGPDAGDDKFTYPSELESRLKREFAYDVHPAVRSNWRQSGEAVRKVMALMENRFFIAKSLGREYALDFLHLTIFYINSLHHDLWNDEIVEKAWQMIDRNIGELLREFGTCNVIIMSDHGSNEIKQVFYINSWLEKQGYLKTQHSIFIPKLLYRLGLNEDRLFQIAQTLHLRKIMKKVIPRIILENIPSAIGTVELEHKANKVDWEESKAFASGQGPVYLAQDDSQLREEIISKLQNLTNPLTGLKIAKKIYKKEDVYKGEFLSSAPDIIIDQYPNTHIRGSIGNKNIFEEPQRWRAENTTEGVFIACGPDFKQFSYEIEGVAITDLAPTILHLMGIAVPEDMDGKVLTEIFKPDSEPAKRKVRYQ